MCKKLNANSIFERSLEQSRIKFIYELIKAILCKRFLRVLSNFCLKYKNIVQYQNFPLGLGLRRFLRY